MRIFSPAIVGLCPYLCPVVLDGLAVSAAVVRAPGTSYSSRAGSSSVPGAQLLQDVRDPPRTHSPTTLADGEPKALFHSDRLDQLHVHLGVVTGQHHLGALRQADDTGHVGGTEVELRTVVVEERRVPGSLRLWQEFNLGLELGVRGVGAGLDDDLAAVHLLALDPAQQQARVVAGLALVEDLVEHPDAGHRRLGCLLLDPNDLDLVSGVDDAALDPAGHHGAAAGDREDVL